MRVAPRTAGAVAILCLAGAPAAAQQVLTFDVAPEDVPALRAALGSGTPVDGIRFDPGTRWQLSTGSFGPTYAGQFNCRSAPYCPTPNGIGPGGTSYGLFGFVTPQRFYGAWVSGPATLGLPPGVGGDPNRVYWELLVGGSVVHTSAVLDVTPAPQFLGVTYAGLVDAVRLNGSAGATVIDDITYGGAAAVAPEPGTVTLLGLGLAGVAGVARRRRRATA